MGRKEDEVQKIYGRKEVSKQRARRLFQTREKTEAKTETITRGGKRGHEDDG